jgi:hypothetical protein
MCLAGRVIGLNVPQCNVKILCAPGEHLPHGLRWGTVMVAKDRVGKDNWGKFGASHTGGIALLTCRMEIIRGLNI